MSLDRRNFIRVGFGLTSIMVSPISKAKFHPQLQGPDRLSFKAFKTTHEESEIEILDIEGSVPENLIGRYLKVGPGQKDVFDQPLNHFFDGDAYITALEFHEKRIHLKKQFLNNPQRVQEQSSGKMLYHEFGTAAPTKKFGRKNQPNINIIPWDNSYLMLSEGGHPAKIKRSTFEFEDFYNFEGTFPDDVSFAAHPKFDPETGEGFAFGLHQGFSRALKVFRLDPVTKKATELYSLNQKHVFMIHDMALSSEHIIFIIPPATFKLTNLLLKKEPLSEAIEFNPLLGARLIILDRLGKKEPIELNLPSFMVFHHAGAFLDGKTLKLYSMLAHDGSLLDLIARWQKYTVAPIQAPQLYEISVDLDDKKIIGIESLIKNQDFPLVSPLSLKTPARFIYSAGMGRDEDPIAFDEIVKLDLKSRKKISYKMPHHQVCSEPCFISAPNRKFEDEGWILFQGLDEKRDESFFDILDAQSLNRVARLWCGSYIPLGFHGFFESRSKI